MRLHHTPYTIPREGAVTLPAELHLALERGELIVCLGPGLHGDGHPSHPVHLTLALLAEFDARDLALDPAVLHEWVANRRAREVLELLERQLGPSFTRSIERRLADRGQPIPPLARALAGLRERLRAVYSSNLDRSLERAFADEWPSFATPQPDIARRRRIIVKLCGTLEFADSWVLTRAAIEREFGQRGLRRQTFAAAYRAHCLLFIGFDPDDELFERLLDCRDAGVGGSPPIHYMVLPGCDRERRIMLERRGLQVIGAEPAAVVRSLGGADDEPDRTRLELPACPYPGLRAFDDSLAAVYHGRRAELSQAAARLGGPSSRQRRWLSIEGPSGVGKSSFVHAGLIPALRAGYAEGLPARLLIVSTRPGPLPFDALARALASALDSALAREPDELAERVRNHAPAGAGLLVIVDQLEETITLAEPEQRRRFAAAIARLLELPSIYVITSVRADLVTALAAALPELARLLNEQAQRYTLAPISRLGLREAIAEPAAQLGVEFDPELVERIASDAEDHLVRVGDHGDVVRTSDAALPLVAHVLRGLWDARAHADGRVTFAEYLALGGVSGALSRGADATLATLDDEQLERAKRLLLRLVKLDSGGRDTRRTLAYAEALALAGGDERGRRLLLLLSGDAGTRLLVIHGEGERQKVDLVHETLLREWTRLRGWIEADRAQLVRDEILADRSAIWCAQGRPWRSLPRGRERRELQRGRPHGTEATIQHAYQRAMQRAAWARASAWVGFAALLLVVGTWVARMVWATSEELRDEVRARQSAEQRVQTSERERERVERERGRVEREREQAELEAEAGRLLDERLGREALEALVDGDWRSPGDGLRRQLRRAALRPVLVGELASLPASRGPVGALVSHPSGEFVVIARGDGTIERWGLGAEEPTPMLSDAGDVRFVRFSSDGALLAFGDDGQTRLLDGSTGAALEHRFEGGAPEFSPDGELLVTRSGEQVNLFALRRESDWSLSNDSSVKAFTLIPGAELIAVGTTESKPIGLWSLSSQVLRASVPGHGNVRSLAASFDGRYLASTGDDNRSRAWLVSSARQTAEVRADVDPTKHFVRFLPRSHGFVTNRRDGLAQVVDAASGAQRFEFECERDLVRASPDGRWLVSASPRGGALVHDAETGEPLARVEFDGELSALELLADGKRVVLVGSTGAVSSWALETNDAWRMPAHRQAVGSVLFSSRSSDALLSASSDEAALWSIGAADPLRRSFARGGGKILAIHQHEESRVVSAVASDGSIRRWGSATADELARLHAGCQATLAATSADALRLALACVDGSVRVVDLRDAALLDRRTPAKPAKALSLTADGRRLAIGADDGTIILLEVGADGPGVTLEAGYGVRALAFAADAELLVSGGNDDLVRIWDLRGEGTNIQEFRSEAGNVEVVAISRDGELIAFAGERPEIVIYERSGAHGYTPMTLRGRAGSVHALSFSADAGLLASGGADGTIELWPIGVDAQIRLACRRLARFESDVCD